MANITITFTNPLPTGIQAGDIAWYLNITTGSEIKMGPISSITNGVMIVNAEAGVQPPSSSDFIFYVKDPIASVSSLKGYFAEAQFINKSVEYVELYSVGSEVFESSK
mgnify:FL=1|jgi:hypothetical protein